MGGAAQRRERDMSEASREDADWIEGKTDGSRFLLPPRPEPGLGKLPPLEGEADPRIESRVSA
jgi:hypothetical protein